MLLHLGLEGLRLRPQRRQAAGVLHPHHDAQAVDAVGHQVVAQVAQPLHAGQPVVGQLGVLVLHLGQATQGQHALHQPDEDQQPESGQ